MEQYNYMENKKEEAIKKIESAVRYAIKNGFKVVVASDEEGNSWNELNPYKYAMFFSQEECMPNVIALGIYAPVDEDEVFKPISPEEIEKYMKAYEPKILMEVCADCNKQITKNKDGEFESEKQMNGDTLCYGCSSKKLEINNK